MGTPKVPIILIPGISGTQLMYWKENHLGPVIYNAWFPKYTIIPETTSGVPVLITPNTHSEQLFGRYDPVHETVEKVSENPFLAWYDIETLNDGNLDSIATLNSFEITPVVKDELRQYISLIQKLESKGYVRDETLFGFGYDWRQTNTYQVDLLRERILAAMELSQSSRVDIICHSMGGIVAKTLLAKEPEFFGACVRKWIACGTPWLGSPALTTESLLLGVELAEGVIQRQFVPDAAHILNAMVRYPSVVELTPKPFYKWKYGDPNAYMWIKDGNGKVVKNVILPSDIQDIQEKVLKDHVMYHHTIPDPVTAEKINWPYPWESDPNVWKKGRQTQQLLRYAELPRSVEFYCIYGTEYLTPFGVTFGTINKPVTSYPEIKKASRNNSFVNGDETVPVESALGHGYDAVRTESVVSTHTKMLLDTKLHDHVLSFLGL